MTTFTRSFNASSTYYVSSYCDLRDLHSFPTRRSSDLLPAAQHRGDRAPHRVRLGAADGRGVLAASASRDRKSTRLNSSHGYISYAVFCLKKKRRQVLLATSGSEGRRECCLRPP